jgi:hypothetical protein
VKEEKAASGEKWETYFSRARGNSAESEEEKQGEERGTEVVRTAQTDIFTQQKLTIEPASNPLPADVMPKKAQLKEIEDKYWETYRGLHKDFESLHPAVKRQKEIWFRNLNNQGRQHHIDALRAQQKRRA